ncbi:hypothetical protein M427DRAFT_263871 [Gonapodya prolifera JEL478]|uniref:FAD-binding FR-type domain-containing protein n=1 Tax=Gonapodya prolifera (strain JEL478) TaxID=1344416 RepID=A0A139AK19_GONPJ|nr:hypothetical protein M427DRAFT_263871 [Gonapodya prolifera JEL478]|eukprot:KXS17121.1 hypothetical protein M427DRAFT_263871 [Gonapodya prolifera JEL478]
MRDQLSQVMGHVDTFRGNDDLVRVWTVSDGGRNCGMQDHTVPASPWETDEVQMTVKTMPDGLATNFLQEFSELETETVLEVEVLGVDGDFSPFLPNSESGYGSSGSPILKHGQVRFAVAGVGITPALSALRGLRKLQAQTPDNPTKLHVMFVAPTVDELLWPVLWSDFILPAILRQEAGHFQDLTATVVVTREGLSSVKKRLLDTMPPGLGLSKGDIGGVVSFSDNIDPGSTVSTITFSASRPREVILSRR